MYCKKCGCQCADSLKYCRSCGATLGEVDESKRYVEIEKPQKPKDNQSALGTAGGVCSLVSWFILPLYLGVIGIILSLIDLIQNDTTKKHTNAWCGLIMGIIGVVVWRVRINNLLGI